MALTLTQTDAGQETPFMHAPAFLIGKDGCVYALYPDGDRRGVAWWDGQTLTSVQGGPIPAPAFVPQHAEKIELRSGCERRSAAVFRLVATDSVHLSYCDGDFALEREVVLCCCGFLDSPEAEALYALRGRPLDHAPL
jgi:hypothetical protein